MSNIDIINYIVGTHKNYVFLYMNSVLLSLELANCSMTLLLKSVIFITKFLYSIANADNLS